VYVYDAFFNEENFVIFNIIVCVCFDLIATVMNSAVEVQKEIVGVGQI